MVMFLITILLQLQVNLDMTDSMGPGKLVRHMQNPSYTYDEYLICIGLGPSISVHMQKSVVQWSVISKFTCTGELGYDRLNGTRKIGPSYAKSVVYI